MPASRTPTGLSDDDVAALRAELADGRRPRVRLGASAGLPPGTTGQVVRLEPGKQTHLSVAWRLAPGAKAPDRIDYGSGWLPIPGS